MPQIVVYIILFLFIFIVCISIEKETEMQLAQRTVRVKSLFWIFIVVWITIGGRNVLIGRDTLGYVVHFNECIVLNWQESKEPLFALLIFAIRQVTNNYHIFLLVCAFPVCVSLYYLMKKYINKTYEIFVAFCIYALLGIFGFNMAGLRQTIAISLGVFAFMLVDKGNWKKSLLLIFIAYLFHNSSIILVLLFPLKYFNPKWYGWLLVLAFFFIGAFIPDTIDVFLGKYIFEEDHYYHYLQDDTATQNYTGFFLQLILVFFAFYRRELIPLESRTRNLFFNVAYIGLSLQALTITIAEFFRLSYYFCIFDIILIPLALSTFNGNNKIIIRVAFIVGCLLYMFVLSGNGHVFPDIQKYNFPNYLNY